MTKPNAEERVRGMMGYDADPAYGTDDELAEEFLLWVREIAEAEAAAREPLEEQVRDLESKLLFYRNTLTVRGTLYQMEDGQATEPVNTEKVGELMDDLARLEGETERLETEVERLRGEIRVQGRAVEISRQEALDARDQIEAARAEGRREMKREVWAAMENLKANGFGIRDEYFAAIRSLDGEEGEDE